jgi:hypothetical protein
MHGCQLPDDQALLRAPLVLQIQQLKKFYLRLLTRHLSSMGHHAKETIHAPPSAPQSSLEVPCSQLRTV